jgi:hypothetical protein
LPVPISPADPRRFHDWTVAWQPFLPARLPDLMPAADFCCGQHCLQFLRFARNSIGGDIAAHERRPMLHVWVGSATASRPQTRVAGRRKSARRGSRQSWPSHTFALLRGGFPQRFYGAALAAPFLEPPGTGARVRGKSRRDQAVSEAKRSCGSFGNAFR